MESSSVWYNIYSYLSKERHLNVVLSNPIKTWAIASAKIKTDQLNAAKLAAGLVPSTYSSGGITYHGSITKRGSKYLRWIMLECAYAHIRTNKNSNITQFYTRLAKIEGNSKAAVAAASKLLKVVYWVMKEKRNYHYHS